MNVSRNFLIIGSLYLLFGVLLGMYMGGAGDFSMASVHAHIGLLGFTLMAVFGCVYKLFPAMVGSRLAAAHFWLHQIGTLILLIMLLLLVNGMISGDAMSPVAPLAEALILIGTALFTLNLFQNAS